MASKQTYECYVCKKNGFTDTRVFLDGKTSDGKTIYKNPDMTPHQHKQQQHQNSTQSSDYQQSEQQLSIVSILNTLDKGIHEELVEIINRLEGLDSKIDRLAKLVYALTEK
jgi:hypothetical protein